MTEKPFHESVAEAIKALPPRRDGVGRMMFCQLGELICNTKIPKNHQAIRKAWLEKAQSLVAVRVLGPEDREFIRSVAQELLVGRALAVEGRKPVSTSTPNESPTQQPCRLQIRIKRYRVPLEPEVQVFHVEVENEQGGIWEETCRTASETRLFLQGVKAGATMSGNSVPLPDMPVQVEDLPGLTTIVPEDREE